MTNREKYAKELLDIACGGTPIAVKNGVPCACDGTIRCDECDLYAHIAVEKIRTSSWSYASELTYRLWYSTALPQLTRHRRCSISERCLTSAKKREYIASIHSRLTKGSG